MGTKSDRALLAKTAEREKLVDAGDFRRLATHLLEQANSCQEPAEDYEQLRRALRVATERDRTELIEYVFDQMMVFSTEMLIRHQNAAQRHLAACDRSGRSELSEETEAVLQRVERIHNYVATLVDCHSRLMRRSHLAGKAPDDGKIVPMPARKGKAKALKKAKTKRSSRKPKRSPARLAEAGD